MNDTDEEIPLPENQKNPPQDKSVGFKPFTLGLDRYWAGDQWDNIFRTNVPEG